MEKTSRNKNEFNAVFEKLNKEQKKAVSTLIGPVRVISGAGTGKTTTLTLRIVNLLISNTATPSDIMAVTFTNKAAREMRERIYGLVGDSAFKITLGTFHGTSMRILREHAESVGLKNERFLVADTDDQIKIIEMAMDELGFEDEQRSDNGKHSKEFRAQAKNLHSIIQKWKEGGVFLDQVNMLNRLDLESSLARDIWPVYQRILQERNSCDFADLLLYVVELFEKNKTFREKWSNRWKFICVDEFQDTNGLQLRWLKHICANTDNLYIIGDPDQSIYAWRNAKADIMTKIVNDWPHMQTIVLKTNYRSNQHILDAANNVVDENPREMQKELNSGKSGEKPKILEFAHSRAEADWIARKIKELVKKGEKAHEIAILVRSAFVMRIIEQELVKYKINYRVSGGLKFFERQEIKDALAYLRLLVDIQDTFALERIVNRPTRGIGEKTSQKIIDCMQKQRMNAIEALRITAEEKGIQGKAKKGMRDLADDLERSLRALNEEDYPHYQVLAGLLEKIGYEPWLLKTEEDKGPEKVENIKEMLAAAEEHSQAEDFLVAATLNEDNEESTETSDVVLSTIHASKGMEFDIVFSPALEEGILPNSRALKEKNGIEEERRICHVAWTRARKLLFISYAVNRNNDFTNPSSFIESSGLEVEEIEDDSSKREHFNPSRFFRQDF